MRHPRTLQVLVIAVLCVAPAAAIVGLGTMRSAAQTTAPAPETKPSKKAIDLEAESEPRSMSVATDKVLDAALALPVATVLGAALALRPRRRGTPARSAPIVQTQIILAVIGALVMLVVGSSLARAFGVVGAAGLVRYRARVQDPKDAGVMLSTLAVGLSAGVGLYVLSIFATVFIMAVLWVIESFEPEARKFFILKVQTSDAPASQPQVEAVLRRHRAAFELRTAAHGEISYEVRLPIEKRTDVVTKAILGTKGATAVDWEEEKKKQPGEV